MSRYIALLRGINISGKNKIPMAELGYAEVSTYLNSGNVTFSAAEKDETALADKIREMRVSEVNWGFATFLRGTRWGFDSKPG